MSILSLIIIIIIAAGYVYIHNQIQPILPLMNQSHNKTNATPENSKQITTTVNANSKNIIDQKNINSNMINISTGLTPIQIDKNNTINNNQNNEGGNGTVPINYSNN